MPLNSTYCCALLLSPVILRFSFSSCSQVYCFSPHLSQTQRTAYSILYHSLFPLKKMSLVDFAPLDKINQIFSVFSPCDHYCCVLIDDVPNRTQLSVCLVLRFTNCAPVYVSACSHFFTQYC